MPDSVLKTIMTLNPKRTMGAAKKMVAKMIDAQQRDCGGVGNRGMLSHIFTAKMNSCCDMVRPRLGLGPSHNHAPAVGDLSVFRQALSLIEAESLHWARVLLSKIAYGGFWETESRSIKRHLALSLACRLISSTGIVGGVVEHLTSSLCGIAAT